MEQHLPLHPESLLEHGPRLRALARRLVSDGHAADDLVQETWVRAVEHGPSGGAAPWQWLARVLRNLAFQDRRLSAHRAEREQAAARREGGGEPEQRFSGHRSLVAAIDRLPEPYRQAILLRYFEDLPPRKIASQLGVPVKTVKTRLNRGLALLREELDKSHGGREQWLAAFAPMLKVGVGGAGGALAGAAREAFTASTALKVAGVGVLLSAGVYLVLPERRGSSAAGTEAVVASGAVLESRMVETELVPPPASEPGTRAASLASSPASSAVVQPPVVQALVSGMRQGRVLDPDGNGFEGVRVGFGGQDAPEPVVSGTNGAFELPDLPGEVLSRDERFATVLISCTPSRPEDERVIVVAPAVTLGGIVRDGRGKSRAAVPVRLEIPLSFRGRFREILDDSHEAGAYAETDEEGRFRLTGVPGLACARLAAWAGHESASVPVPEHDDLELELVLSPADSPPPGPDSLPVLGEVRRQSGVPAPGALVSLAGVSTRADAEGLFELHVPRATDHDPEGARQLVAVARGEQAAILSPGHDASGSEIWPPFATLWLGQAPQSIVGRLIGTDGSPLANAPVWIDDLTYMGATRSDYLTLEHELAGKPESERWFVARTNAQGRFELGGLGERAYTLAAMDPATLQVERVGPIAAGSCDVEIVLTREGLWERVAGRVVDTHGEPIASVPVALERVTFRVYSFEGGLCYGRESGAAAQTDENGRFELTDVPKGGMTLHVWSQAFAPVDLELENVADPLDVRFEVLRLGHVQIELAGSAPGDGSIVLLDEHDQSVDYYVFGGGSLSTRDGVDLGNPNEFADGRTPVMSVPETARAAVLRDGDGNELRRVTFTVGAGLTAVQL